MNDDDTMGRRTDGEKPKSGNQKRDLFIVKKLRKMKLSVEEYNV